MRTIMKNSLAMQQQEKEEKMMRFVDNLDIER